MFKAKMKLLINLCIFIIFIEFDVGILSKNSMIFHYLHLNERFLRF